MRSDHKSWTTEDELQYLNTIGENFKDRRGTLCKIDHLKRYLAAMDRRFDWGNISPVMVRSRCQFLIDKAGKK